MEECRVQSHHLRTNSGNGGGKVEREGGGGLPNDNQIFHWLKLGQHTLSMVIAPRDGAISPAPAITSVRSTRERRPGADVPSSVPQPIIPHPGTPALGKYKKVEIGRKDRPGYSRPPFPQGTWYFLTPVLRTFFQPALVLYSVPLP